MGWTKTWIILGCGSK